jgi:hypothetical protein
LRTTIATLIGATLIVSGVVCTRGLPKSPAWTRWGITKPTTEPGAEAKLAEAYQLLYDLRLDTAPALYADLVKSYAQSAEAHLGLSMACRYTGNRDSALAEARRALKLDSAATGVLLNYADLILPHRSGPIPDMTDSARYAESDHYNLKAAASKHPFSAQAHVSLWFSYMERGRLSDARHEAFELGRTHYYPQPLLDYGYNLLVGLEPNAILFTNGDNDTYPPWVLQQGRHPLRPDVTVTNLSLLNIPAVTKMMRDSLGLPVSLTDEEIDSLAPRPETIGTNVTPPLSPAQQVIQNILANAPKAGRPIYSTLTLGSDAAYLFMDRLVVEGVVNRVVEDKPTAKIDFDRLAENLTKKYRLGWPKTFPKWPANMSPLTRVVVAPLAQNYGTLFAQLAWHYDSLGSKAKATEANSNAVAWMVRGNNLGMANAIVDAWLARDSSSVKAKEWKVKLEKAAAAQ